MKGVSITPQDTLDIQQPQKDTYGNGWFIYGRFSGHYLSIDRKLIKGSLNGSVNPKVWHKTEEDALRCLEAFTTPTIDLSEIY